jgi:hypothetical protein
MPELESRPRDGRASLFTKTMKLFGIIMVLVYIGFGVAVIMNTSGITKIPQQYAIPLGGFLIVYGCFRGFRLYQELFRTP